MNVVCCRLSDVSWSLTKNAFVFVFAQGVFESNPCKHPVVILKDVQFVDLRAIVNFIYNGEVNIEVDRINEIIQVWKWV